MLRSSLVLTFGTKDSCLQTANTMSVLVIGRWHVSSALSLGTSAEIFLLESGTYCRIYLQLTDKVSMGATMMTERNKLILNLSTASALSTLTSCLLYLRDSIFGTERGSKCI
jgi:hypothetical protein